MQKQYAGSFFLPAKTNIGSEKSIDNTERMFRTCNQETQKTSPQSVRQHHRTGLHTYKQIPLRI